MNIACEQNTHLSRFLTSPLASKIQKDLFFKIPRTSTATVEEWAKRFLAECHFENTVARITVRGAKS